MTEPEPAMSLTIQCTTTATRYVLSLEGVIDLQSRDALRLEADRVFDALTPQTELVIDLAGVTFIDSSGLGILVEFMNRGTATGTRVIMRDPSGPVTTLFSLTALDRAFTIETSG
jgi:anti-anti-sigma factor